MEKLKIGEIIYYKDINYRVYVKDGVKSNSPYYEEYFRPIKIEGETEKEYILEHNYKINKKSNNLLRKNDRLKYFTEKEKEDDIYVEKNKFRIIELLRCERSAEKIKRIEEILNEENRSLPKP